MKKIIAIISLLVLFPLSCFAFTQNVSLSWDYPSAPPDLKGFKLLCWNVKTGNREHPVIVEWDQSAPPWKKEVTIDLPTDRNACVLRAVDQAGQESDDSDIAYFNPKPGVIINLKLNPGSVVINVEGNK